MQAVWWVHDNTWGASWSWGMYVNSVCKSYDKRAIIFLSVLHFSHLAAVKRAIGVCEDIERGPNSNFISPTPQYMNGTVCIVQTWVTVCISFWTRSSKYWCGVWSGHPQLQIDLTICGSKHRWNHRWHPFPSNVNLQDNSHMVSTKNCAFISKSNGGAACAYARDNRMIVQMHKLMRPAEV